MTQWHELGSLVLHVTRTFGHLPNVVVPQLIVPQQQPLTKGSELNRSGLEFAFTPVRLNVIVERQFRGHHGGGFVIGRSAQPVGPQDIAAFNNVRDPKSGMNRTRQVQF